MVLRFVRSSFLMAAEVAAGTKVLHHHEKPFTAIIGGAKVTDKIMILERLLEKADNIIIGGGMAYSILPEGYVFQIEDYSV